jgi:hypothetical protein
MKFNRIFFFAVLLITSCSTTYELGHTEPKLTYTTTRSTKQVMKCIRDKWREHLSPVQEEKTSQGWLVRHFDTFPSATIELVTIEGTEPNVVVKYFQKIRKFKIERLEKEVMGCQ